MYYIDYVYYIDCVYNIDIVYYTDHVYCLDYVYNSEPDVLDRSGVPNIVGVLRDASIYTMCII